MLDWMIVVSGLKMGVALDEHDLLSA